MENEYILELNHIEKEYFGNKVLKDVSFKVKPGEILALIGENGAGKSTIMNILFGMPVIHETGGYKGDVLIDGKKVNFHSPNDAMHAGLGMVHQEFMLIDSYNVTDNVKLNREQTKANPMSLVFGKSWATIDDKKNISETKSTLERLNLNLSENAVVGNLPVGYKQFVEIARELDKSHTKLIILDEPTAVLTENESAQFLKCVRDVADNGIAVIFISHRLDEIMNVSNRVVILKDGELVGDSPISQMTAIKMSKLMVGREVEILNAVHEVETVERPTIIEYRDFSVNMPSEQCKHIDLDIKQGEIIGIAGLAGHGKMSLATGIMGLFNSVGKVFYKGKELDVKNTQKTITEGIVFVSEDRRGTGLLMDESIERNITVEAMRINGKFLKSIGPLKVYDKKEAVKQANNYIEDLSIRCTGYKQAVRRLSGGNQQKVCLARALVMDAEVLFVSEPTRGIDIGAKKLILDLLLSLNKNYGKTIIVTSSELAELQSICERIVVITEGKVAGILKPSDESYKFGLLMSGAKLEDHAHEEHEQLETEGRV
ncbi:MAG: sugar ABC transporter ATP-binding protein [Clostridiales bacterium]|nr:sugar ABC transporter ATP-binding protein [Clostridiales bacterium]